MDLIWTESYASAGVDEICRKIKIQKGSFYHFFPSKVDLAVTALSETWTKHEPQMEEIFNREKPGLQRLMDYLAFSIEKQKELKIRFGFFPGCPLTSIGIERGSNDLLRKTAEGYLDRVKAYFEKAVADAAREGTVKVKNPSRKASEIFSLHIGAFTRLRIANDIGVLNDLKEGILCLLGLEALTTVKKISRPYRSRQLISV